MRESGRPDEGKPGGRRFLSLDLPRLAIERHLRRSGAAEDALVALAVPGPHGPVVHAATRAAEGAGARPGQRVVDARGACPGLQVEEADPRGDVGALDRLVLWARRWCPWTAAIAAMTLAASLPASAVGQVLLACGQARCAHGSPVQPHGPS